MTSASFDIAGRAIGAGHPTYVIAELSANHLGDQERCLALIRQAKRCGADAVKTQTYTADTLTIPCDAEAFRLRSTIWEGTTLHDLYGQAYTPWEWHGAMRDCALAEGLEFFSTAYDPSSVAFLEELGVPAYKVASFEIVDIPLLKVIAQTRRPVVLSTGMATLDEIGEAVEVLQGEGAAAVALLVCTSSYPARPEDMRLRRIQDLSERFGVVVGLSDHSLTTTVPVAAVSMGARIVEKHFTLSRDDAGPDSSFSLEPAEFEEMVESIRCVEAALGEATYGPSSGEKASMQFRRSLFVVRDVEAGAVIGPEDVRSIRPARGLSPKYLERVIGARALRRLPCGTPLSWDLIEEKGGSGED